ncbi:MAG: flavin reductase domain protein FMN-binding [Bradyrhizobium sp.]|nr:flavin reductase domain protein FMN-binding [Bradyrhizobium sp.]
MTEQNILDDFKLAMRRIASTVALITSGREDGWLGMAATAVVSVCADPPTLLIAVNRTASLHPTLHAEQGFCVNLLSERHRDLVEIFSGRKKGRERFESGDWVAGPGGLPLLNGALANLICQTTRTLDVGTHTLFIGEVKSVVSHDDIDPLLWIDGRFAHAVRQ